MRRVFSVALLLALTCCAAPGGSTAPRFPIFFQEWSAKFDDQALGAIAAAAKEANMHPNASITVIGYADPSGSPQANVDLSRTRAQVVSDALTSNGIAPARISRSAQGATTFAQTAQESRRVEIVVGP